MLSAHSIPTIVARMVLEQLQKKLAFSKLFNRDYIGEVSYGGSVKIVSIGSINVTEYTRYDPLIWQQVTDDSIALLINQGESVSFAIDDLDKVQARPSILAPYIRQSAIDLRDKIDQYLALTISEQANPIVTDLGTDAVPLDINSANIDSIPTCDVVRKVKIESAVSTEKSLLYDFHVLRNFYDCSADQILMNLDLERQTE